MEPWVLYLEWSSRPSKQKIQGLLKKQFWMRPFSKPVHVIVTLIYPKCLECNAQIITSKIVNACTGVLWERALQIRELYYSKRVADKTTSPRIILKIWSD